MSSFFLCLSLIFIYLFLRHHKSLQCVNIYSYCPIFEYQSVEKNPWKFILLSDSDDALQIFSKGCNLRCKVKCILSASHPLLHTRRNS